jgi:hypothetical protein
MPITSASLRTAQQSRTAQRRFALTVIDATRIGLDRRSGSMKPWKIVITTVVAVLLAFAVLAYAMIAPEGLSARKKPSNLEYALANWVLALSIQSHQKTLKNPLIITPVDLSEARKQYMDKCAWCHAKDGSGKTEMSAGMSPEVPDLRAAHIQRLTDGELLYIIKNGVRFTAMPAWDMSDQHYWRLVALIRRLPNEFPSGQTNDGDQK